MPNARRGEATLTLDGQKFDLIISLGTLARMEKAFNTDTFYEAIDRLFPGDGRTASAKDVILMIYCLLEGNGYPVTPEIEKTVSRGEIAEFQSFLIEVMSNTFPNKKEVDARERAENPPMAEPFGSVSES